MKQWRILASAGAAAAMLAAGPAAAQFFFKPPMLRGTPVTGAEPGIVGPALPGATPMELRAALVWNLRAGLNVAALQCDFAPTLLTVDSYNQLLGDHADELKSSYATLANYFNRVAPKQSKALGQKALDQYGTKVYSSFSTVGAQLTFCHTAGRLAQDSLFTPRGSFATLAIERMRELRNSLQLGGEQQFSRVVFYGQSVVPDMSDRCWKRGAWNAKKCGPFSYGGA